MKEAGAMIVGFLQKPIQIIQVGQEQEISDALLATSFWHDGMFPWDVAAGILIIQEAGGIVTNREGKPLICPTAH